MIAILLAALLSAAPPFPAPDNAPSKRAVAFTFDDVPHGCSAATNRDLVAAIKRNRIPALGLAVGTRCSALYRSWTDAGIELGNHTASHRDFNVVPLEQFQEDVIALEKALPAKPRYFRFPFLRSGTELAKKRAFERFLTERGYTNAVVTIDNDEYIYAAVYAGADDALAERIRADYLRYMESIFAFYEQLSRDTLGYELPQILLLHDNRLNADALDSLAAMARRRGYRFVSIDEALEDPAYRRNDAYVGRRGLSWLHRWALDDGKKPPPQPDVPDWVMELYRAR